VEVVREVIVDKPVIEVKIVEKPYEVVKIVEVEKPVTITQYVEVEKIIEKVVFQP